MPETNTVGSFSGEADNIIAKLKCRVNNWGRTLNKHSDF